MIKKIAYSILVLFLLAGIAGFIVIKKFNDQWFKEQPNHLTYSFEEKPIQFEWAVSEYENYIEQHSAILIPIKLDGLDRKFYLQFDTGAQTSFIYGIPLQSLRDFGLAIDEIKIGENRFIDSLNFNLGGSKIVASKIRILEKYGQEIDFQDTTKAIKIGTLGADFLSDRITMIDFKNERIHLYHERPSWMSTLNAFSPFDFKGRRFMLPVVIDGKSSQLYYDSGSSAFGLITSKKRFDKYTNKNEPEINYNANRWGEALPIHHKKSIKNMEIGQAVLDIKRISYVDMYADFQHFMSPFTKIGGWLGNKPFIESALILDTKKEEFIVIN